jgi:nucleolar complex protein 3
VSKKKAKLEKRKLAAKLRKEVESDVREAEAVLGPSERRKLQSQTVAAVFETYFRVLKDADSGSTSLLSVGDGSAAQGLGPRPLLVAALEGLSRLSHLIRWVSYRNRGFQGIG